MIWNRMREEALAAFKQMPPPKIRHGQMKSLEVPEIDQGKTEIKPMELPKVKNALVIPLKDALKAHAEAKRWFAHTLKADNPLTAFHLAKWERGAFIHIKEDAEVSIDLNTVIESNAIDHILIVANPRSKSRIIDSVRATDGKYASRAVEIIAKDDAKVDFRSISKLSKDMFLHSHRTAVLGKNAEVNWLECSCEGKFLKSSTTTMLNGPGSRTSIKGVYLGAAQFDVESNAMHNSKETKSDLLTKAVLTGKSRGILAGKIKIGREAQGSDGYQTADALLLSEDAEAQAIPLLEIDNHDVKCSHGATVTQVDKEQLFYLQSRGLSKEDATRTIMQGFLAPVLEQIPEQKKIILPLLEAAI